MTIRREVISLEASRAAVDKAPEAFRTISEVAQELDVPQHVLRFWESRFREIKPMKRGGGRRYYRPNDLDLLRGIRHLLYSEGYTIRGVQRVALAVAARRGGGRATGAHRACGACCATHAARTARRSPPRRCSEA